jgi:hypothetical protein
MSFTCIRCKKKFRTIKALKAHAKKHLKKESLDELVLLEKGHVPKKNKIGSEFKGKNKIIIS